jgi:hypothetical protein
VVYVGQTLNLSQRVGDHRQNKLFDRVFHLPTPPHKLDRAERRFIEVFRPKYNGEREWIEVYRQARLEAFVLIKAGLIHEPAPDQVAAIMDRAKEYLDLSLPLAQLDRQWADLPRKAKRVMEQGGWAIDREDEAEEVAEEGRSESSSSTDPDLAAVVDAWSSLPPAVRASIMMLVRAAAGG